MMWLVAIEFSKLLSCLVHDTYFRHLCFYPERNNLCGVRERYQALRTSEMTRVKWIQVFHTSQFPVRRTWSSSVCYTNPIMFATSHLLANTWSSHISHMSAMYLVYEQYRMCEAWISLHGKKFGTDAAPSGRVVWNGVFCIYICIYKSTFWCLTICLHGKK